MRARLTTFRLRRRQHWYQLLWHSYQHVMVGMSILHKKRIRMKLRPRRRRRPHHHVYKHRHVPPRQQTREEWLQSLETRLGISIQRSAPHSATTPTTHTHGGSRAGGDSGGDSDGDGSGGDGGGGTTQPITLPPLELDGVVGEGSGTTYATAESDGNGNGGKPSGDRDGHGNPAGIGVVSNDWLVPTDTQYGKVWLPPPVIPPPLAVWGWEREEVSSQQCSSAAVLRRAALLWCHQLPRVHMGSLVAPAVACRGGWCVLRWLHPS